VAGPKTRGEKGIHAGKRFRGEKGLEMKNLEASLRTPVGGRGSSPDLERKVLKALGGKKGLRKSITDDERKKRKIVSFKGRKGRPGGGGGPC